ncbi:uncharacterized protein LOC128731162 [Anopheles nili]|uniref:uncharacterized protein LOC128731162 n=1 Tax=Anopheles nili TaxID=185578 RepID=UPI00237A2075|nr:uncharacterized protein LOC128731162 [Anopheles nili]
MDPTSYKPLEPTKPPEIDPDLTASAANAVEQWRNYQQAYAAYQQQCAAYHQYVQQSQYAQTVEQQQMIYSQYLEQHRQYQYHLQQYEQQKMLDANQIRYDSNNTWSGQPQHNPPAQMPLFSRSRPPPYIPPNVPPPDIVNSDSGPPGGSPNAGTPNNKRVRNAKAKQLGYEKKSELHMKTVIFVNPDDENLLPADLKQLFKDLHCNLCRTRMNSHISANIHYQSKAHEKKINQWLKEYCSETGTPLPVRPRLQPELAPDVNVVGKALYHCDACDLPLTSIQHANQHYTGKRHWLVVNGKKLPSGEGFFNDDGKWTRSTNVVSDNQSSTVPGAQVKRLMFPEKNGANQNDIKRPRLQPPPEPPEQLMASVLAIEAENAAREEKAFKPAVQPMSTTNAQAGPARCEPGFNVKQASQPIPTFTVESDDEVKNSTKPNTSATVPPLLQTPTTGNGSSGTTLEKEIRKKEGLDCVDNTGTFCTICETSVTSRSEMLMHLKGAKHLKKARTMGMVVRTTPFDAGDTILKSLSKPARQTDWSLYRMPSGKFYCKTCNLIVADEKLFGQHWYGKKHKLKQRQEKQTGRTATSAGTTATGATEAATEDTSFASDNHELTEPVVAASAAKQQPVAQIPMKSYNNVAPPKLESNPFKPQSKRGKKMFYANRRGRFMRGRPHLGRK